MLDDILAIPAHLRDALWRIESARLEPAEAAGVLVCGMGGSAIGGDLAAEALGARRIVVSTGGALTDAARAAGVPVVGLPGILQPRAAVAYMFAVAAEVAALVGAGLRLHTEIDAAAGYLERETEALQSRAAEIAASLNGVPPVIYGADLTVPVAMRWKTQINENAKLPAFYAELPEADHNELCGWAGVPDAGAFSAVLLEDSDQHPRERRRFELTADSIAASGSEVVRIEIAGETRVERLLWATMLGDLVSVELADTRGIDPMPVEAIENFKAALANSA